MASTNKTTHYDLPLFVGTDKPTWLGDFNSAMTALDNAIYHAAQAAATAQSQATTANSTATAASSNATTAIQNASHALNLANGYPASDNKTLIAGSFGGATVSSFTGNLAVNANKSLAQLYISAALTGSTATGSTVIATVPGYTADTSVRIGLLLLQYTTSSGATATDVYTLQLTPGGQIISNLNYRAFTGTAYATCCGLIDISAANASFSPI